MLVGFVFMIVIGAFAPRVAQAEDFYYRWTTPLPDVRCSTDGNVYLSTTSRNYEYNLPVGATLDVYFIHNGVSTYAGNFPLSSGSGSGSFAGYSDSAPAYPFTSAIRYDTLIDGEVVYHSTIIFTCLAEGVGTAEIINSGVGAADACLPLPVGSVVGDMPLGAQAYYAPGQVTNIEINPGTYWVLGEDESGQYYKILLACQYLWVRTDMMQPNFVSPWSGQPLPTQVVS